MLADNCAVWREEDRLSREDTFSPDSWLRVWLRVHGPRITDAAVSLGAIGADTPAAIELQDALSAAEEAVAALRVEVEHG